MANQDFLFDKRIVQRNIDKGLIESKDLEKRLKSLTDLTEAATVTSFEGVVAAAREVSLNVPLVVRLEGTNVAKAREILAAAKNELPTLQTASELTDAAKKVVAAAK